MPNTLKSPCIYYGPPTKDIAELLSNQMPGAIGECVPDEGVNDSVILGFRSFTMRTATAAMAAMKTTLPTTMPAKAPSEIFLPELFRLTVPA